MERDDIISITLTKYKEPQWKLFRQMSYTEGDMMPNRFAIDLGHISIIVEIWYLRNHKKFVKGDK